MNRLRLGLRLRAFALWMAAVALVSTGLVLDDHLDRWRHSPREDGEAAATSQPAVTTVVGHVALGVETKTYPPGHAEAWDQDIGLHAVSVVAGTLTVHSGSGTPTSYGPGQGYVAGWAPYRAVIDGSAPLQVVVTRLARREPDQARRNPGTTPRPRPILDRRG